MTTPSSDLEPFLRLLDARTGTGQASLLDPALALSLSRAPGRLDVMGGVGDYSGCLVLEMPIAEATYSAAQRRSDGRVVVESYALGSEEPARRFVAPVEALAHLSDPAAARSRFTAADHFAAYIVGVLLVLAQDRDLPLTEGLSLLLGSTVPEGKGVSSSAAVEVATCQAVAQLWGLGLDAVETAALCQRAENEIAGAPCGIMDQLTSAAGRTAELLAIRCQPYAIVGSAALPPTLRLWGIDSARKHSVAGSAYTTARVGAFMGYRILCDQAGVTLAAPDRRWHGYLANVTPQELRGQFAELLPLRLGGRDFLNRYDGTTDPITRVDPEATYPVRAAATYPILENARAHQFHELLPLAATTQARRELGQLMFESHEGYSAMGLGASETDRLVELVRALGPERGLYGARVTGGGSGGTVAVLGRADAEDAVSEVVCAYQAETGLEPYVFRGSSPGAAAFGAREARHDGQSWQLH